MLHPHESAIAGVTLIEIPYPDGKRIAGSDFHAVAERQHRADLANTIWAVG
jgi:hypothetical protein